MAFIVFHGGHTSCRGYLHKGGRDFCAAKEALIPICKCYYTSTYKTHGGVKELNTLDSVESGKAMSLSLYVASSHVRLTSTGWLAA